MIKPAFIMAAVIALAACSAGVTYHPYVKATFPPSEMVEVFNTKSPERDYIELGIIEVRESVGGPGMVERAIVRAKAVGADGLILLEAGEDTGYYAIGGMMAPVSSGKMKFTAIRYK